MVVAGGSVTSSVTGGSRHWVTEQRRPGNGRIGLQPANANALGPVRGGRPPRVRLGRVRRQWPSSWAPRAAGDEHVDDDIQPNCLELDDHEPDLYRDHDDFVPAVLARAGRRGLRDQCQPAVQ